MLSDVGQPQSIWGDRVNILSDEVGLRWSFGVAVGSADWMAAAAYAAQAGLAQDPGCARAPSAAVLPTSNDRGRVRS